MAGWVDRADWRGREDTVNEGDVWLKGGAWAGDGGCMLRWVDEIRRQSAVFLSEEEWEEECQKLKIGKKRKNNAAKKDSNNSRGCVFLRLLSHFLVVVSSLSSLWVLLSSFLPSLRPFDDISSLPQQSDVSSLGV